MLKRVLVWILLIGFVLLLVNIMIFQFYLIPSIAVYLVIAIWFVFNNKPLPSPKTQNSSGKNDTDEG